jgi:hypothetical protein
MPSPTTAFATAPDTTIEIETGTATSIPDAGTLQFGLAKLERSVAIRNQIDNEYADMSLDLAKLGNEQVNSILRVHIDRIIKLQKRLPGASPSR